MQYGHFNDARREYDIERHDTPLPRMHSKSAFDYYKRVAPAYRKPISEICRLEPCHQAQMIDG